MSTAVSPRDRRGRSIFQVEMILSRRQLLMAAGAAAAPGAKQIALKEGLPAQPFGKTGHRLPVLACGGSSMVERWSAPLAIQLPSFEGRVNMIRHAYDVGIRYFDSSRNYWESEAILGEALKDVRSNIYLASKVGVAAENNGILTGSQVRASLEQSLKTLRTDSLDCIQIHGPVYEYQGYDRAMEIYQELARMREEKLFRFIGVTGHTAFETMHRLIDTKLFDQVLMAYGYFPKGMDTLLSHDNLQWRELCLSRARELGMGILAMKVMGSFVLGHNAGNLVPDFGEARLRAMRQAALRWALRGPQPPVLLVGVSIPADIDENIRTLAGDRTFTAEDQKLLAEFAAGALKHKAIQALKTV
jgi:aryl-alcohol dehydrogenase-like predicted oxidoreductase